MYKFNWFLSHLQKPSPKHLPLIIGALLWLLLILDVFWNENHKIKDQHILPLLNYSIICYKNNRNIFLDLSHCLWHKNEQKFKCLNFWPSCAMPSPHLNITFVDPRNLCIPNHIFWDCLHLFTISSFSENSDY